MKSLAFLALAAFTAFGAKFSRPIVYFPTDPAGAPGRYVSGSNQLFGTTTPANNLWKCV